MKKGMEADVERLDRWFRSWSMLLAANLLLFALAACAGWLSADRRGEQIQVRPSADVTGDRIRSDAAYILRSNLRVAGGLLAGGCTLGLFTLVGLLYNAFLLGYGLSALARGTAEIVPFLASYVPLEFLALILVATATQHLSFGVVRCLATGEPVPLKAGAVGLGGGGVLLVVAAVVEASVMPAIAAIAGQTLPPGGIP